MSVSVSLTVYDELGNIIGDGSIEIPVVQVSSPPTSPSTKSIIVQSVIVAVLVALILMGVARGGARRA